MNTFQNIFVTTAVLLTSVTANAQHCENGVCKFPARGQSANNHRRSTAYDSWRSTNQPSSNTACHNGQCGATCDSGNCQCGPNCCDQLQTGNRQRGTIEAPRPVSNRYQAVGYQTSIPWISTYEQALQQSRATGRPMLVKVSAEWCGFCKQMKRETFSNAGVIRDISSAFVPLGLDADANRKLVEQMGVRSLPAVLVITPDLRIVERIEGFRTPKQLSNSLLRHTQRAELKTGTAVACR